MENNFVFRVVLFFICYTEITFVFGGRGIIDEGIITEKTLNQINNCVEAATKDNNNNVINDQNQILKNINYRDDVNYYNYRIEEGYDALLQIFDVKIQPKSKCIMSNCYKQLAENGLYFTRGSYNFVGSLTAQQQNSLQPPPEFEEFSKLYFMHIRSRGYTYPSWSFWNLTEWCPAQACAMHLQSTGLFVNSGVNNVYKIRELSFEEKKNIKGKIFGVYREHLETNLPGIAQDVIRFCGKLVCLEELKFVGFFPSFTAEESLNHFVNFRENIYRYNVLQIVHLYIEHLLGHILNNVHNRYTHAPRYFCELMSDAL